MKTKTKDDFKTKGKGKGKGKPYTKPNNDKGRFENTDKFDSTNNPSWYTNNAQVARDAASISYSTPLGSPVLEHGAKIVVNDTTNEAEGQQLPGILRIGYYPGVGISNDKSSPVNLAAQQIYSWVRHANSGSRNYEFPDYMMYLLALDSAYAYHAQLVRCYGLFSNYSYKNRYVNRAIIEACGFDYDDIQQNLASFRTMINQFGVKLNTLATPKQMSLYDRHSYLALNVFADSTLDTSSLYVCVPEITYIWDGEGDPNGTQLIALAAASGNQIKADMNTVRDNINNILYSLLSNEDVGIMSGDTLKAFGESGLRTVEMIPESAVVKPIYDEGMLCQIHNLTYLGKVAQTNISQDPDKGIITEYEVIGDKINLLGYIPEVTDTLLDSGMSSPTPEFNLEATRFKYTAEYVDESESSALRINNAGTEIVSSLTLYTLSAGEIQKFEFSRFTAIPYLGNAGGVYDVQELYYALLSLTTFDWAPIVNYESIFERPDEIVRLRTNIIGPVFNYTVLSNSTLYNINQAVLQSLLNVYGTYISKK